MIFPLGHYGALAVSEILDRVREHTLLLWPDHSVFMVQDRKKLRPGVVGGKPGVFAFSSEICGLDAAIPNRDKSKDFQPMHLDTALVGPGRQEVRLWSQKDPLPLPH